MIHKDETARFALSVGILVLFAYAYVRNPSEQLLIGALISMASGAVNYWLGSSKGSADKSIELSRQAQQEGEG